MDMRLAAVAIVLCGALTSCGGPMGCTLMGCSDSLRVAFDPPLGAEGAYEVVVEGDAKTRTCTATLPLGEGGPECERGDDDRFPGSLSLDLDRTEPMSLRGVWVYGSPKKVNVTVRRDGVLLASETFEPSYEKTYPNGPECGPTCFSGSAKLPID